MTATEMNSDWVVKFIETACNGPGNNMEKGDAERAWDMPLIGFANGADPLFDQYKTVVGSFHWKPLEIWQQTFPSEVAQPEDLTVISWVLPQTMATKRDQREATVYASERWARSRVFGEAFNRELHRDIAQQLTDTGFPAVAPMEAQQFSVKDSKEYVYASTWSERHAAFAAGLGTFGLCDGLITSEGKAMRVGSVVARIAILATPRRYSDHPAYCLFYAKGTCGECINRCPAGALSENGHDKVACKAHLDRTGPYVAENCGFVGYGCGLFQVSVPCESGIPAGLEPAWHDE
jgi:epoxyqueuosine reductase QueG